MEPTLAPLSVYLLFPSTRTPSLNPYLCRSRCQSSFNASPKDLAQRLVEKKGMRNQGGCRRIIHAWALLCCETFCESATKPFFRSGSCEAILRLRVVRSCYWNPPLTFHSPHYTRVCVCGGGGVIYMLEYCTSLDDLLYIPGLYPWLGLPLYQWHNLGH